MEPQSLQIQPDQSPGDQPAIRTGALAAAMTVLLGLAALAVFVYPMYVIRPFRAQGATELAVALAIKQGGVWVTVGCAIAALICLRVLFQRPSRLAARVVAIVFTALACGSIWLARFNVYEKMFHPIGAPLVEPIVATY